MFHHFHLEGWAKNYQQKYFQNIATVGGNFDLVVDAIVILRKKWL